MARACTIAAAALLAAVITAALTPRPARACSCVAPRLQRTVIPADGTKGFPTDGTIRVFLEGGFPEPLRSALAKEYRLRKANGNAVSLDADVVRTRLDLRPATSLEPNTRYTLERIFAYGPDGVRLSDTERVRTATRGDASAAASLARAWFPVVSFETGKGPAPKRSADPDVTKAERHFAFGGGDCGPGMRVYAELALSSATKATDIVQLHVRGEGVVDTRPARRGDALAERVSAGDLSCNPSPVTIPASATTEVRIVLRDASGNRIGKSEWTTAQGQPRSAAWKQPGWRNRRRRGGGAPRTVSRWLAPPVVNADPKRGDVPQACPHGFAVRARHEIASEGGRWSYEAQSTLGWRGDHGWLAVTEPSSQHTRVHRLEGGSAATAVSYRPTGTPATGWTGRTGPYFVTERHHRDKPTETVLHALDDRGDKRWTHPLAADGGSYRITGGGGRVLVTWLHRTDTFNEYLAWAVLDAANGELLGSEVSSHRVGIDARPGATFLSGHFLIAAKGYRRAHAQLVTVSPDASERRHRRLPFEAKGAVALASSERSAALASVHRGEVHWTLLAPDGDVREGPTVISKGVASGDNRLPRIAHDGELFAVAWEAYPTQRTYAAAVDRHGRSSAVRPLAEGISTSTVGIAPRQEGFMAAYTRDRDRAFVVSLRCRSSPPSGAPQRISR